MHPQDYSQRCRYRPPESWYRRINRIGVPMTSLGLAPRGAVTLTTIGRNSGRRRSVPILVNTVDGDRYLVSLAGESHWVRNVRAAEGRDWIRRGRSREVRLVEMAEEQRSRIIAAYLEEARRRSSERSYATQAGNYFGIDADPSRSDIEALAAFYPVFRIDDP